MNRRDLVSAPPRSLCSIACSIALNFAVILLATAHAHAQTPRLRPIVADAALEADAALTETATGTVIRYNPRRFENYSPALRRFIFLHEMAHLGALGTTVIPATGWTSDDERAADRVAWWNLAREGWTTDELRALREEMTSVLSALPALARVERLTNLDRLGTVTSMLVPAEVAEGHWRTVTPVVVRPPRSVTAPPVAPMRFDVTRPPPIPPWGPPSVPLRGSVPR